MRKALLHPFLVFCAVWGFVLFLYGLKWSDLQDIELSRGMAFFFTTFAVFLYVGVWFYVNPVRLYVSHGNDSYPADFSDDETPYRRWFFTWIFLSILEIAYSGGVPIYWTISGSAKTYFDFGIPTLHGFLNGLISSLSLIWFSFYQVTKKRKYLYFSLFVVVWGAIAVTRQLIIVNLFQFLVLWLATNKVKFLSVLKLLLAVMLVGLSFGWLGDARTGADKFIGLAMPSDSYPEYLPSGALWVYMYAVTPLMNLLNTINTSCGCESWFFGNTLAPLLPSFLRVALLPVDKIEKGNVVSEAFNVSTAFVDPYTDSGYVGIAIFTLVISVSTIYFWYGKTTRDLLIFSVLLQALILTIFYNHFFSLPVISQVLWIYLLVRKKPGNSSELSTASGASSTNNKFADI